jgi:hypothetical protein
MAQCVNLPREIRNGKGLGATQVVGRLPLVRMLYIFTLVWLFDHLQFI